ncbi:hypothetical protein TNCV_1474441 [Trichonephila clavipes]|nr:hypothetical protein TNCV_1474441 [Trichonephila clavipes]
MWEEGDPRELIGRKVLKKDVQERHDHVCPAPADHTAVQSTGESKTRLKQIIRRGESPQVISHLPNRCFGTHQIINFSNGVYRIRRLGGRKPWERPGASHLSSPSTNHTKGFAARRLFRVPPCGKGTIYLQTSMSSPGFKHSPYSTAVSVANHYTGWATLIYSCPGNSTVNLAE